ncbi:MAG: phosphoenolpyruvate synthase [Candidatus Nomurabacteria bacterium]|nr:MAG: phosphoenolpyruvate synthase [Candidatus Nomurabacteria bacterium]
MAQRAKEHILWFNQVSNKDVGLVGGKNASLGEMYRRLTKKGVYVPNGFAITAEAYQHFITKGGIKKEIRRILKTLNTRDTRNLMAHGEKVRALLLKTPMPADLEEEIKLAYDKLSKEFGTANVDVAVRSSATAEDLPDASFAGQQETYLNIRGHEALLDACRKGFASLFTNRAISYREDKGFDHFKISLSLGVQKMVRSDLSSSGVMFSIDTESGFRDAVLVSGSYGLGENIVQGAVTPDEWYVFKPTLAQGYQAIISRKLGDKKIKMIYTKDLKNPTKNVPVPTVDRPKYCLTDKEVTQLAKWAVLIEKHYKKPMDMEWAKDGQTGQLYIVQARPETVMSQRDTSVLEEYSIGKRGRVLSEGTSVGSKIGVGKVRVIKDVSQIHSFKAGEVLVTRMTDPDWEPIMKIASAIVTEEGGRTSHAAIVSRELGLPAVVGTGNATKKLKTGQMVTISCAEGERGYIYAGKLPFTVNTTNLKNLKKPKTKIQIIFGTPEFAFQTSQIPNDGVGLAREEVITASHIQVHPLALIHFAKLKDQEAKKKIEALTVGYDNKKQYYVDTLAQGIAMIAAAFYPKEVILRLADFRSNEYAELIGGHEFEPEERNPMIGWRGASRYYDPKYRPAFDLECKAIKKVRDEMGLKNLKIMVPFCRTVEEGKKVIAILKENGLVQHKDGLEIFVMCEIPSNVVLADKFADIFDGFSIGSNDLTQLTLGLDRDSALIAHVGNENNEAVHRLLAQVIEVAKRRKKKIGICGQGPSDYPQLARFLVEQGIDALSINPDTVLKTMVDITKFEKRKRGKRRKK